MSHDVIRDAREDREAAEKWRHRPRWQPIKTAPKNNTSVLIYVPPMAKDGTTGFPEIIMVSRFKGYWWDAGHLKPTHWMPLPAAPEY